jgi:hypothetical protein
MDQYQYQWVWPEETNVVSSGWLSRSQEDYVT